MLNGFADLFNGFLKHGFKVDQVGLPHPFRKGVVALLKLEHGECQGEAGGGVVSALVDVLLHPKQFFVDDDERKALAGDVVAKDTGVHAYVVAVDDGIFTAPADDLFYGEVSGTADEDITAFQHSGVGVEKFTQFVVDAADESHVTPFVLSF